MRTAFVSMTAATIALAMVLGCRSSSEGGAEGAAQDTVATEATDATLVFERAAGTP